MAEVMNMWKLLYQGCFENGTNVCCCLTVVLVAEIGDDKLAVAIEEELWKLRLSSAKFAL